MSYSFLKPDVIPDQTFSTEKIIPRKIWQTCKDESLIPPEILECISGLKKMNPTWEHTLFDDKTQYEFIKTVCSDRFCRAYERIQPLHGAARADIFRYLVVFLHGGVYLDLKSGTTRPLDEILRRNDTFIVSQWDNGPDGKFPGGGLWRELKRIPGGEYEQWLVIASPGHPFLSAVIEQVLNNIETYNALKFGQGRKSVLRVTGPKVYTLTIHPMLKLFPHRKIVSYKEGLNYTMLEQSGRVPTHGQLDPFHYSRYIVAPVTSVGLTGWDRIKYFLGEAVIWPVSKIRKLNYQRVRKRRQNRLNKS